MLGIKKIEIRHSVTNKIIFEFEKENNTIKDTVVEAVKNKISLCGAYLRGASLRNADLHGADLRGADLRCVNLNDANLCDANLEDADLSNAFLCSADLSCAELSHASLCYTYFWRAYLRNAFLCGADLLGANLREASLYCASLCYANLCRADLRGANLLKADLYNASLGGANLYNATLNEAKNIPFIACSCPLSGSFIGWKKISWYKEKYHGMFLVKLLIPEDAKRCSATTEKCRCNKAKVLEIRNIETDECVNVITNTNIRNAPCTYKVGEMVYPDSFDEDRWNECSHGIHFFTDKQLAIDY